MKASSSDKAYFRRVALQNRLLASSSTASPPTSLREVFDRLKVIEADLAGLAVPGKISGDGDLQSHLSFLQHLKSRDRRSNA